MRGLVVVLLVLLAPTFARAQAPDPAGAEVLFREGREAADRGEWETACDRFAASQRIEPAAGTLFNLAHCEEQLGHLVSAWMHYHEVAPELPGEGDNRRPFAEQHAAALDARIARLTLQVAAELPGLEVVRDDVTVNPATFGVAVPVDPGAHAITIRAAGHQERRLAITLAEGESRELTVEPGPELEPPAPPAPKQVPRRPALAAPPEPKPAVAPYVGWSLVATGAAGAVLGTIAGIAVLKLKSDYGDHCDADFACDDEGLAAADAGEKWGVVSTVAFVAGGIALAAGTIVLVVDAATGGPTAGATVGVRGSF